MYQTCNISSFLSLLLFVLVLLKRYLRSMNVVVNLELTFREVKRFDMILHNFFKCMI